MKLLVKMYGGSHMHGTNTPLSDTDFLGVFLPELDDLILEKAPKHKCSSTGSDNIKNTKEDTDSTYYSLQYFLKLLAQGQTVALEMVSVKKENLLYCTPEWEYLMENKEKFYTKNMKAFLGYCKSQAHIYSRKGERINLVKDVLSTLCESYRGNTVEEILNLDLNLGELQAQWGEENFYISEPEKGNVKLLNVCGRKFQFTLSAKNFIDGLTKIVNSYGDRAKEVANNTMDCKAVSHAFRVLGECKEIIVDGTLTLPIKNKDFVMKIKTGQADAGYCFDLLDKEIQEVEELIEVSSLPEKVDMKPWEDWLVDIYYGVLCGEGGNYEQI